MPCKTKSRESSRKSVRTVHDLPPGHPQTSQIPFKIVKKPVFVKKLIFQPWTRLNGYLQRVPREPPSGTSYRPGQKTAKTAEKLENRVFHKNLFFDNFKLNMGIWGCPGAWHGPCEPIPSNFGGIWSYMEWGKSIFMFFGNIGNSLHHQIPPNWSSGLQIGPRIFWEARAPNKTNYFSEK